MNNIYCNFICELNITINFCLLFDIYVLDKTLCTQNGSFAAGAFTSVRTANPGAYHEG